jgi:hypothetical protein
MIGITLSRPFRAQYTNYHETQGCAHGGLLRGAANRFTLGCVD